MNQNIQTATVTVSCSQSEAVAAGRTAFGKRSVALTEAILAQLGEDGRALIAQKIANSRAIDVSPEAFSGADDACLVDVRSAIIAEAATDAAEAARKRDEAVVEGRKLLADGVKIGVSGDIVSAYYVERCLVAATAHDAGIATEWASLQAEARARRAAFESERTACVARTEATLAAGQEPLPTISSDYEQFLASRGLGFADFAQTAPSIRDAHQTYCARRRADAKAATDAADATTLAATLRICLDDLDYERFERGLMCDSEIKDTLRAHLFAKLIADGLPRYTALVKADIECECPEGVTPKFSATPVNDEPISRGRFVAIKSFTARCAELYADAEVDLVKHSAWCGGDCDGGVVKRYSLRARRTVGGIEVAINFFVE